MRQHEEGEVEEGERNWRKRARWRVRNLRKRAERDEGKGKGGNVRGEGEYGG